MNLKRGFVVFLLGIFLIGSVSAVCDLVLEDDCTNANTLLKLSSRYNAHGELASGSNYDYVVCCDELLTPTTCAAEDKLLYLSGVTNAHASIGPANDVYDQSICFSGLSCSTPIIDGGDCPGDENVLLSLSSISNAHISFGVDYNVKICCGVDVNDEDPCEGVTCAVGECNPSTGQCVGPTCGNGVCGSDETCLTCALDCGACVECPNGDSDCDAGYVCSSEGVCIPEDADDPRAYWGASSDNIIYSGDSIGLNVENHNLNPNYEVYFEIIESDDRDNLDNEEVVFSDFITNVNSDGNINYDWVVTQDQIEDLDDLTGILQTLDGDFSEIELYFRVYDDSDNLIATSNELSVEIITNDRDPYSGEDCDDIARCIDYETPGECEADLEDGIGCFVGDVEETRDLDDYGEDCVVTAHWNCKWSNSACGLEYASADFEADKCSEADDNGRYLNTNLLAFLFQECGAYGEDVTGDCSKGDDFKEIVYSSVSTDPICSLEDRIVPCGSRGIGLPFFGGFGFVMSLLFIFMIYFVLEVKRK
jgi:hypothetical protein